MSAVKRSALGKGLGALIEDAGSTNQSVRNSAIDEISINYIEANPFQPRTEFDEDALNELSQSIKELGIIQPITVRKIGDNKYQLISGERRFRASQLAGLDRIPAYVRTADDQGMLEMALVENIQREDLDAIEVAISYQRLIDECKLTQENMSDRVGKKRSTVTNYLRLLKLPAEIQLGIRKKLMSMGHARALVNVEDTDDQLYIFEQIINESLSVRKVEDMVRKVKEAPSEDAASSTKQEKKDSDYKELEKHLASFFKSKIEFKRGTNGNGKIVIPFKSDEDLERIIAIFDKSNS
ncbi:MAG: ParB/RepB/Spo0J family partition protein [Salinivirgaceae bacterium]|jgi:ParB family chromosome partitioning protein|nr:ParB/RepB/Spo0J family partition protein [Salinivirgaceae bacterium]